MNSILGIAGVPPIRVEAMAVDGIGAVAAGVARADADHRSKRDPSSLRSLGMTTKGKGATEVTARH